MNIHKFFRILIIVLFVSQQIASQTVQSINLLDYVNPLVGTFSNKELSNGNTYPAIAVPWGMNFWTPQTATMGDGWIYSYSATKITGIRQTHQPSPWIGDYAAFSLMAVTGNLKFKEDERASWFSHKAEISKPNYYSVYLADHDVTVEVTPTERAAVFRFTYPNNDNSYIILDAFNLGSMVKIIPEERKIIGYCKNNTGGVPSNFKNYFVAVFDKDFGITDTWKNNELLKSTLGSEGEHVGAIIGFKTRKGEQVQVKIASSFISEKQAELNLSREVGNKNFEAIKLEASQKWEKELRKIKVEGGDLDQTRTFYSSLYRMLLFPRSFFEIDSSNQIVHYSPYNGKTLPGYMFTDNGFWDTFRAVFPFFTLMYPEQNSRIMQGLVNTYNESGWLPEWASPGHRDCMIGSNSASLIADSYMKGIRGSDIETLYNAVLKNSQKFNPDIKAVGRYGADYYNTLGYVPYNVGIKENTARTLEYAYADFCIWQLAKELKRPQFEIDLFAKRMLNYKNVFDKESGLMRGKNEDGSFQSPFNPLKWGDAFTEGNSLHYTWSVFHDIQGLIKLMGGNDKFIQTLDTVLQMPPNFDDSYYGFPIHEIREMQIANMGNYAHGNQPIQHMVYLYNYAGKPWKTQFHVRNIMNKMYNPYPDGYCGDEDNGQTSAWYVQSAMGFYSVCPGANQYVVGAPLFKKVTLSLENGKKIEINAPNNSASNLYVQSIEMNGKKYSKKWFGHQDLLKGAKIKFNMASTPNKSTSISLEDLPYSVSNQ